MSFSGIWIITGSVIRCRSRCFTMTFRKMFSILYDDGKSRMALEDAVDFLKIEKTIPFPSGF